MKKVRITTTRGSKGKNFKIFNSPESLYVWLNDPELQEDEDLDPTLGNIVNLRKGEVMEVEWCGFEHIYEDGRLQFRADYVKIGKLISVPVSFLDNKEIVGIQDGWVTSDILSCKSKTDESTKIVKLTARSKHRFNLDELFMAREAYDSTYDQEKETDYEEKDIILN
jgi:hypothetical protein